MTLGKMGVGVENSLHQGLWRLQGWTGCIWRTGERKQVSLWGGNTHRRRRTRNVFHLSPAPPLQVFDLCFFWLHQFASLFLRVLIGRFHLWSVAIEEVKESCWAMRVGGGVADPRSKQHREMFTYINKTLEITLFHRPPKSVTLSYTEERLLALLEHRYLPNIPTNTEK